MLLAKINRTLYSLLNKHYIVEYYSENDFYIYLSFYHLNSVYNGLVRISKENGDILVDFQHHRYNKLVHKQLANLSEKVYRLYKLKQITLVTDLLSNYKPLAQYIYNQYYSLEVTK